VEDARKAHEEALAIREELGERGTAAESRVALAQVSLEEGVPVQAEVLARQAAGEQRAQKAAENEAYACAVLARSLVSLGKTDLASKEIDRALGLLLQSENRTVTLPVTVIAARVWAAKGRGTDASRALKEVLAQAGKLGLVGIQLETRLALADLELRGGGSQAGRARLTALEKDATAKGFQLVAKAAAAALRQP
jgi:hypothetical protein